MLWFLAAHKTFNFGSENIRQQHFSIINYECHYHLYQQLSCSLSLTLKEFFSASNRLEIRRKWTEIEQRKNNNLFLEELLYLICDWRLKRFAKLKVRSFESTFFQ